MSKEKKRQALTAKEQEAIKAEMDRISKLPAGSREQQMARMIGDVYDVEMGIPEVISPIARTASVARGEHLYYLAPKTIDKTVNTLTSNCEVTQTKVTPEERTEVTWTHLVSPQFRVCIQDWLEGDHNVLDFYARATSEAMDRQEAYAVLNLVSTGASNKSNTYTLDSGKERFDFPKLVEMARSLAKYGNRLVLITGSDVTTDIALMDYRADTNREYGISRIVDQHIKIEDVQAKIDGVDTDVLASNKALLVATSDSEQNRPIIFARRRTGSVTDDPRTQQVDKERIIIDQGNLVKLDDSLDIARAFVGYESYSGTSVNDFAYAEFTRT